METKLYEMHHKLEEKFWYFTYKTKLVREFLRRACYGGPGTKYILDVGCGTGSNIKMLREFGRVFGVDNNRWALHYCAKRGLANLIQGDSEGRLPVRDGIFDIVTALDILEHVGNEQVILKDIGRILKKGAKLIITVPAFSSLWSNHDKAAGHKRRYIKSDLIKNLISADFTVERCTYFNCFVFFPVFIFRSIFQRPSGRKRKKKAAHLDFDFRYPGFLNKIFFLPVSGLELFILRKLDLPFGVSMICVCKKTH